MLESKFIVLCGNCDFVRKVFVVVYKIEAYSRVVKDFSQFFNSVDFLQI